MWVLQKGQNQYLTILKSSFIVDTLLPSNMNLRGIQ